MCAVSCEFVMFVGMCVCVRVCCCLYVWYICELLYDVVCLCCVFVCVLNRVCFVCDLLCVVVRLVACAV